jgi:hypothetical protein
MLVKEATAKPMTVPGPMGTSVPIDLNNYIPPWVKKWLLI